MKRRYRMKFLVAVSLCVLYLIKATGLYANENLHSNLSVVQQNKYPLHGIVTDTNKEPIIGASVFLQGTQTGTVTDLDGKFQLDVTGKETIVVTYVGFETANVAIKQQTNIDIVLKDNDKILDEVVVVGYGTQKKVNLTGSVSSVDISKVTEGRPVVNIAHALAGEVPGMYIGPAGNPSSETPSILLRGKGTLNNSSPLVIIDGVEGGLGSLNPEDIESISVLKDAASSAIYGSRAANGVILVTTKKGKTGKVQINLNNYISFESVKDQLEPVSDYARYMELINEAYTNVNQPGKFSKEKIEEWRNAGNSDPFKYPNVDWRKEIFRTAISNNHVLSVSGGSDKTTFFSSFRFANNPGIIENTGAKRYDFRTNLEIKPQTWLTLGANLNGYMRNMDVGSDLLSSVFTYAQASTPGMYLRTGDGVYGTVSNFEEDQTVNNNNILAIVNSRRGDKKEWNGLARFYGVLRPVKGLTLNGSFSYTGNTRRSWYAPVFRERWNFYTDSPVADPAPNKRTFITKSSSFSERIFMDATAVYDIKLINEKLALTFMGGATQEQFTSENDTGLRYDLIDPGLSVPDAAGGDATFTGGKSIWVMRSYFGRINAGWDNKYLFEFNLRSDASSRFRPDKRWGYFPSASFAWRIDQENFMKGLTDTWLDALKLRLSYGSLGNNSIGNYESISVYAKSNYVLNHQMQMGMAQSAIANANVTWESTDVTNIGLDFTLLKNRLSGSVDLFNKNTRDILMDLPAPDVHGTATIPHQNSAQVRNRGFEVALTWRDKVGSLNYFVRGNFSFIKNKVLKFKGNESTIVDNAMIKEGLPINSLYLREFDRILQTPEDMALVAKFLEKYPLDNNGKSVAFPDGVPQLGDILYKDLNGDGIINNEDRRTFGKNGDSFPILFGVSFGADWKGFDASVLIQGNAGMESINTTFRSTSVNYGNQINKEIADGRWYPDRNDAAKFPRLTNGTSKNTVASSFWVSDRSYVKVRNIQVGYSFPAKTASKLMLSRLRVYGSLENFFTFTSWPGIDPELPKMDYPTTKQAVVGINLSF